MNVSLGRDWVYFFITEFQNPNKLRSILHASKMKIMNSDNEILKKIICSINGEWILKVEYMATLK